MKILLQGFKGRFEQTEERIGELEDRTMEMIESEEQKEKKIEESGQSLRILWDTIKWINICIMGVPAREEKERGREYLKK